MLGHSCGYYLADRATELRTMQESGRKTIKIAAIFSCAEQMARLGTAVGECLRAAWVHHRVRPIICAGAGARVGKLVVI